MKKGLKNLRINSLLENRDYVSQLAVVSVNEQLIVALETIRDDHQNEAMMNPMISEDIKKDVRYVLGAAAGMQQVLDVLAKARELNSKQ